VAVMRVLAGVRGQWPDGAARAAARAVGGVRWCSERGAPLRGGRSRSPIRGCSGLAGVRAASEQIGGATNQRVWHDALTSRFSIGVKTSGPNERIQILCGIQIRSKLPEWLFSAIYQSDWLFKLIWDNESLDPSTVFTSIEICHGIIKLNSKLSQWKLTKWIQQVKKMTFNHHVCSHK
jgi:hypothetical protein